MSYQINQRISPTLPQPSMGINVADLDKINAESIKQGINDNPAVKIADNKENPALLLGLTLPAWLGMGFLMAKFNDACAGEYKDSLVGKIGQAGDTFSNKFISPQVDKGIQNKAQALGKFLDEKVIAKFKILTAFFKTPSVPTQSFALMNTKGTIAELSNGIAQVFEKFTDQGTNLEKVKQLGFVKDGKADLTNYQYVVKNSHTDENIKVIMEACKKQGLNGVAKIEKGGRIWGAKKLFGSEKYISELLPFTKPIFCRDVRFSEFVNKLQALQGLKNTVHATSLGKVLPKATLRLIEGFTNASAGAGLIFGTLFAAYFIADSVIKSANAPKGEKGKTFADNLAYSLGFYLTMPLGMKIMHGVGGLQYIGMSKEQVEAYRNRRTKFNTEIELPNLTGNKYVDKAKYKNELKELKIMKKGTTAINKADGFGVNSLKFIKNLVYRPLQLVGDAITVGLESNRGYMPNNAQGIEKFFRNLPFNLKRGAGYPVRFLLFQFVIGAYLTKLVTKGAHLVFGRPTKSILDEEPETKEAEKVPTAPPAPTAPTAPQAQPPQIQPAPTMQPIQQNQRANLVDMYNKTGPMASKSMVSTPQEPVRTYVPSTEGVKIQSKETDEKNDKLNTLLGKADRAEMAASKFIVAKH